MNISSSSTYSVSGSGASGKGISGLASGMDTDSMVEQMLAGTQSKIDDQLALQQQWTWKQEMYREIITTINSLHNKFFDTSFEASSTNNLASADFFNTMISKVTGGSNFLNIISSSPEADVGNMNVTVAQLASATKLEGKKNFSSNELSGKVDLSQFNAKAYVASIKVGDKQIDVDLKGLSTSDQIVSKLNEEFKNAGVTATAKLDNARISFTSDKEIEIVDGSDEGLAALGVQKGAKSSAAGSASAQVLTAATVPTPAKSITFTITFNGVSKQIAVNPEADKNGKITEEAVQKALGKSIQEAFGGTYDEKTGSVTGGYIEYKAGSNGEFTLSTDEGNSFRITDLNANAVGLTPGSSSTISTMTKLKDLMTKDENGNLVKTTGGTFKFTINGVNFSFDGEDTVGTMINKINSSSAGVKLSYSALTDGFKLESTSSGAKYKIEMSQEAGDVLSLMFGEDVIQPGSSIGSEQLLTTSISGSNNMLGDRRFAKGATFSVNINGNTYSYTLGKAATYDEVVKLINEDLASKKNGYEKFQTADGKPLVELKVSEGADNQLSISLDIKEPGTKVSFTQTSVNLSDADAVKAKQSSDIAFGLGFTIVDKNNIAGEDTKISELEPSVQAALKRIDSNLTDDSVLSDLSRSGFSFENGRVVVNVTSRNEAAMSRIFQNGNVQKLFGGNVDISKLAQSTGSFSTDKVQQGTDSVFYVNGEKVTRNTNVVTIGGVTMELTNAVSQSDWVGSDGKPVDNIDDVDWSKVTSATINTERDVDSIVDVLKSFVEEYNKMVDQLTGYTDADPNYRKYPPLTEAQRKEMSEKEIEQWEEKSKEGLLRRDSDIDSFLSQMRLALYSKPDSSKFALYDIGIDTGTYDQKGKLVFNETALRKALADDAESVKNLFTDSVNGLSKQLTTIMDNTAKLSSGSPGTLVREAGAKGYATESDNNISNRLKTISDKIKELRDKYETERQRYWNMFSNMETVLSNYNTQSGWLSQQFSY